ncbi:MAG: hypothetical protein AAFY68_09350, partial [Pseudomonadota bacterium]
MTDAPLLSDLAEGPQGGAAHWLQTSDAQRIRIGIWPAQGTAQGTRALSGPLCGPDADADAL